MESLIVERDGAFVFSLNGIEFPVDPKDMVASVKQLDMLSPAHWQNIMLGAKLPIDPWLPEKAKPVLMGIVQNAWYERFDKLPDRVAARHPKRIQDYCDTVAKVAEQRATAGERLKEANAKNPRPRKERPEPKPRAPKTVQHYTLKQSDKKVWSAFTKQRQVIVRVMLEFNRPAYSREIAEKCMFYTSRQTPQSIVNYYLGEWKKAGLVEVTNAVPATN